MGVISSKQSKAQIWSDRVYFTKFKACNQNKGTLGYYGFKCENTCYDNVGRVGGSENCSPLGSAAGAVLAGTSSGRSEEGAGGPQGPRSGRKLA